MLKRFLLHSTGSIFPHPNTIRVEFSDLDVHGAIAAHTCDKLLVFPKGVFEDTDQSFLTFKSALMAVVGSDMTFNTV